MKLPTAEEFELALSKMDQGKLNIILERMDKEILELDSSSEYRAVKGLSEFSLYLIDEQKTTISKEIHPNWQNVQGYSQRKVSPTNSLVKSFVSQLPNKRLAVFANSTFSNNENLVDPNNDDELKFAS